MADAALSRCSHRNVDLRQSACRGICALLLRRQSWFALMREHEVTANRRLAAFLVGALLLAPFLSIHAHSDVHGFTSADPCYDCAICLLGASASGDDTITHSTQVYLQRREALQQRPQRTVSATAAAIRSAHRARAPPISLR
jgi:hypothetical protein